jgi:4-diphosphocytidyl-2-C-methyl-D-erythritol kinase
MVKLLSESAPAKINLFLRVSGRRADGYHEIDSIFVPVSICDRLEIELRPARSVAVDLRCDSQEVPAGEHNLAVRAAREFLTEFGINAEVLLNLHKKIPIGAGLGGGSSDAGTVLRMMAALCKINAAARLAEVALKLGADVPFFLNPVPARVRGIGERIDPLRAINKPPILIAIPAIEVSTAFVFQNLQPDQWSGPAPATDIDAVVEGRLSNRQLVNDLETTAIARWPQIRELKKAVEIAGARAAAMTGSGGGIFGIFGSSEEASRAHDMVHGLAPEVQVFTASIL